MLTFFFLQMTVSDIFSVKRKQFCLHEFKQLLTNLLYYLALQTSFLNYYSPAHAQINLKRSSFMNMHTYIAVIHFQIVASTAIITYQKYCQVFQKLLFHISIHSDKISVWFSTTQKCRKNGIYTLKEWRNSSRKWKQF